MKRLWCATTGLVGATLLLAANDLVDASLFGVPSSSPSCPHAPLGREGFGWGCHASVYSAAADDAAGGSGWGNGTASVLSGDQAEAVQEDDEEEEEEAEAVGSGATDEGEKGGDQDGLNDQDQDMVNGTEEENQDDDDEQVGVVEEVVDEDEEVEEMEEEDEMEENEEGDVEVEQGFEADVRGSLEETEAGPQEEEVEGQEEVEVEAPEAESGEVEAVNGDVSATMTAEEGGIEPEPEAGGEATVEVRDVAESVEALKEAAGEGGQEGDGASGEVEILKKRKKGKKRARKGKEKPLPMSPVEEALMRSAAGRITLAMLLVQKELLRIFLPQLYLPLAVATRVLKQHTTVFMRLGLAPDPNASYRRRMPPRGAGKKSMEEEEEEEEGRRREEEQELAAERLMPAPISRFARVSAAFIQRHGLVDEEKEVDVGDGGEEEERGSSSSKPMFSLSFNIGSTSETGDEGRASRPGALDMKLKSKRRSRDQGRKAEESSSWGLPSTGSISGVLEGMEADVTRQVKAINKQLTGGIKSLAKAISKTKIKSSKRSKPPRRYLFDDDDDDEGGAAAPAAGSASEAARDPIGIPPRRRAQPSSPPSTSTSSRGKKSTPAAQMWVEDDDDDEDDWLRSSRKPKGASRAASSSRGRGNRSRSWDDDEEKTGADSFSSRTARPFQGSDSGRLKSHHDGASIQERLEQVRKQTSETLAAMRRLREENEAKSGDSSTSSRR